MWQIWQLVQHLQAAARGKQVLVLAPDTTSSRQSQPTHQHTYRHFLAAAAAPIRMCCAATAATGTAEAVLRSHLRGDTEAHEGADADMAVVRATYAVCLACR